MLILLLTISAARAACEGATMDAVSASVSQAQLAMASYDEEGFTSAAGRVNGAIPCLTQVATPLDAAVLHGFVGLEAFVDGRSEDAKKAFAAAHAVSSAYTVPSAIAPTGSPLASLLAEAWVLPPSEMSLLAPYDGQIYIDGARSATLLFPKDRPSLIQLVTSEGSVRRTIYHLPGEAMPTWEAPRTGLMVAVPQVRERPSVPLGIVAGGSALAAGGLYAWGAVAHDKYTDPNTPYDELTSLETQTNVALGSSIVLAVTAAAFGTVTVFHW